MNSKQRRKERRRFRHTAEVDRVDRTGLWLRLAEMDEWCMRTHGADRYRYWNRYGDRPPVFAFESESDMVRFKLVWG